MSNEYKDWERDKIEEEKLIVTEYPFLRVRDIDGTVDMNAKFPLMYLEIPDGWYKLFFQMCDDIKPILQREGILETFSFIQVKEKYNQLRCYHRGAPAEVDDIIQKYEVMASYICTKCGQPASRETRGYIASFCEGCWKEMETKIHDKCESIEFKPYFKVTRFSKGEHYEKTISFEDEWNRYIKKIINIITF